MKMSRLTLNSIFTDINFIEKDIKNSVDQIIWTSKLLLATFFIISFY